MVTNSTKPFLIMKKKTLTETQHLSLFDVHGSSARRDITDLICNVTSNDHLIEASCAFMVKSSLCYVTTLIRFMTIDIVIVEGYF